MKLTSEQIKEIRALLTRGVPSPQLTVALSGVRHVTTVTVTTFRADYKEGEVTIEIRDDPSRDPADRYHCVVTAGDGRRATGHRAPDPVMAITIAHWWDLFDREGLGR